MLAIHIKIPTPKIYCFRFFFLLFLLFTCAFSGYAASGYATSATDELPEIIIGPGFRDRRTVGYDFEYRQTKKGRTVVEVNFNLNARLSRDEKDDILDKVQRQIERDARKDARVDERAKRVAEQEELARLRREGDAREAAAADVRRREAEAAAASRRREEEAANRRRAEEAVSRRRAEEAAAGRRAEEAVSRRREEEAAAGRRAEEAQKAKEAAAAAREAILHRNKLLTRLDDFTILTGAKESTLERGVTSRIYEKYGPVGTVFPLLEECFYPKIGGLSFSYNKCKPGGVWVLRLLPPSHLKDIAPADRSVYRTRHFATCMTEIALYQQARNIHHIHFEHVGYAQEDVSTMLKEAADFIDIVRAKTTGVSPDDLRIDWWSIFPTETDVFSENLSKIRAFASTITAHSPVGSREHLVLQRQASSYVAGNPFFVYINPRVPLAEVSVAGTRSSLAPALVSSSSATFPPRVASAFPFINLSSPSKSSALYPFAQLGIPPAHPGAGATAVSRGSPPDPFAGLDVFSAGACALPTPKPGDNCQSKPLPPASSSAGFFRAASLGEEDPRGV